MSEFNLDLVMVSITAQSREDLTMLQRLNNEINGKMYNYQFPFQDGDLYGVWFYADVTEYKPVSMDMLEE